MHCLESVFLDITAMKENKNIEYVFFVYAIKLIERITNFLT